MTRQLFSILRARLASQFVEGCSKEWFLEDNKTQSSVIYQLLVIGEAVKRLTPEFRASQPDVPWSLIAGMRDRLIHAYDAVDWEEVWTTVETDVPTLHQQVSTILAETDEMSSRE